MGGKRVNLCVVAHEHVVATVCVDAFVCRSEYDVLVCLDFHNDAYEGGGEGDAPAAEPEERSMTACGRQRLCQWGTEAGDGARR